MSARPDVQARHRQRRQDARRRILDAALDLLEDRPWSEISLGEIMSAAHLSRTAFYRHFDDRQLLLLALLEDIGVRMGDSPSAWERGVEDPVPALRAGVEELTQLYVKHGRLLNAIAQAAEQDAEIYAVYMGLADRYVANVKERIEADVAAGRTQVEDPEEVARALVWMNHGYLNAHFGRAPLGDPQRTAAALAEVWITTLYGSNGAVS